MRLSIFEVVLLIERHDLLHGFRDFFLPVSPLSFNNEFPVPFVTGGADIKMKMTQI